MATAEVDWTQPHGAILILGQEGHTYPSALLTHWPQAAKTQTHQGWLHLQSHSSNSHLRTFFSLFTVHSFMLFQRSSLEKIPNGFFRISYYRKFYTYSKVESLVQWSPVIQAHNPHLKVSLVSPTPSPTSYPPRLFKSKSWRHIISGVNISRVKYLYPWI